METFWWYICCTSDTLCLHVCSFACYPSFYLLLINSHFLSLSNFHSHFVFALVTDWLIVKCLIPQSPHLQWPDKISDSALPQAILLLPLINFKTSQISKEALFSFSYRLSAIRAQRHRWLSVISLQRLWYMLSQPLLPDTQLNLQNTLIPLCDL